MIIISKYKTASLFFLIVLFFLSCKQHSVQQEINEIQIKYVEKSDRVKLSSIVSDIKYLPLETSKDLFMGTIEKIEILDKISLVSD